MSFSQDGLPVACTIKILLIGESGVGKSSLLQRFVSDTFNEQQPTTIGVDFSVKYITCLGQRVKLTIWDTAGQEKFRALTSTFYRGAKGVVLVYDVTQASSLDAIREHWLQELTNHMAGAEPIKMVIANKVDMESAREVEWEEGLELARESGSLFVEASAKSGVAVASAFEELVMRVLEAPGMLDDGARPSNVRLDAGHADMPPGAYCAC